MAEGPVAPPAVVGGVIPHPGGVAGGEGAVEALPRVLQPLHEVDAPGGVHVAAAAVAHKEPVELAAPEDRRLLVLFKRQHAVIFKQHAGIRPGLPDQLREALGMPALARGGVLLLHEPRAHVPVHRPLDEPADCL